MDRTSRWPEAIPVKSIRILDTSVLNSLSHHLRYRITVHILHLVSVVFLPRYYSLSTYTFHPQANGPDCQLKVSLRARLAGSEWFHHLPLVLLGLRNVPREDSSVSATALFGTPLTLPGEFLNNPEVPSVEYLQGLQQILKNIPVPLPHHSVHSPGSETENNVPTSLLSCSHIFVQEDAAKVLTWS